MEENIIDDSMKNYNYSCLIKYKKIDDIVFLTNLVVKNGIISIEKLEDNRLVEKYILGTINNLDSLTEKIYEDEDVYEEYRNRLLEKNVPVLFLEIYETLAGTGFIDNTLDLVQLLECNNVYAIIETLKEFRKNIYTNLDDRYTEIEKIGYANIISGYIMRLEEERRKIINEKK